MTKHDNRAHAQAHAQASGPSNATDGRTHGRTDADGLSPSRDTSSSVTRGRTYGDSPELSNHQRWRRGERTARTPENLAAIRELCEDGLSDYAIARRLNMHHKTVWMARREMGLDAYQPGTCIDEVAVQRAIDGDPPATLTPAETTEAVRILTQRGYSSKQIAARLRVTSRTVARHRIKSTQENAA